MEGARCIALLAGNAGQSSTADRRMIDGPGVTLLASIEEDSLQNSREMPSVPVFLELHMEDSIRFLTRFSLKDSHFSNEVEAYDPKEHFTSHPRFANGNIFTASCLGATVARSFNMPGIVELMEALCLGINNDQQSFPWQVRMPEGFDGKKYSELTHWFLENHGAVSMGLFRLCFDDDPHYRSDGDPRYVMTHPRPTTIVKDTDWIFVLGSAQFGKDRFEKGALVGTDGAAGSDEPEAALNPTMQVTPRPEWPEEDELFEMEVPLPRLRTPVPGVRREFNLPGLSCRKHQPA